MTQGLGLADEALQARWCALPASDGAVRVDLVAQLIAERNGITLAEAEGLVRLACDVLGYHPAPLGHA